MIPGRFEAIFRVGTNSGAIAPLGAVATGSDVSHDSLRLWAFSEGMDGLEVIGAMACGSLTSRDQEGRCSRYAVKAGGKPAPLGAGRLSRRAPRLRAPRRQ